MAIVVFYSCPFEPEKNGFLWLTTSLECKYVLLRLIIVLGTRNVLKKC